MLDVLWISTALNLFRDKSYLGGFTMVIYMSLYKEIIGIERIW